MIRKTRVGLWVAALSATLGSGCPAISNPVADGVEVRKLPPELLEPSKTGEQTIPLTLLGQPRPPSYKLDAGDVLGVYVEGFLGEAAGPQPLPIHVGSLVQTRDQHRFPPSAGYPVPVEDDGTIYLPSAGSVIVRGKTLAEARELIRLAYAKQVLEAKALRVIVNLIAPRQYSVVVMRQESASFGTTNEGPVPTSKRGTGHFVDLLAYENDVLHALAQTGGLPGLDAYNAVVIQKGFFPVGCDRTAVLAQLDGKAAVPCSGGQVIRIPLRQPVGCAQPIRAEDVILQSGDVVFLESRDLDVFFTGGLLPTGAYVLPRDYDLDVLEAVSRVRGPLFNGAFGGSNLSGNLIQPGIGGPSPSLLAVLRRTPGGGQVSIVVDLREATRHPEERLVLRPGDVLILQEKPSEALARYVTQTFFNFNVLWQVFKSSNATGIIDVAAPDRLTPRLGQVNVTPQ